MTVPLVLAGVSLMWPGPPAAPSEVTVPVSVGRAPTVTAPTAPIAGGTAPAAGGTTTAADRQRRAAAEVAVILAAAPITFPADSADLTPAAAATVGRVTAVLRAEPGVRAHVIGFCADGPGPAVVAQQLSERRAEVVAEVLAAAGVNRARLVTEGLGNAGPLATRAASRRVEIQIP
ncbi:OmpA family protein [Pseudonocardia sp.]|uniref:OmpA family protein n=1 Tax=Pseudonocardia sp. TaxID=60912 RepID=UPI002609A067|nr:OmpA family protein [Pseudonocardia sp.]MCW2719078.1 OmpA/MotB domain protein [Pseudonocardia sp.]